jgi:hypothetical protein
MTLAVKENEPPDPADVSLFCSQAVVLRAQRNADEVKETRLRRSEFDGLGRN